MMNSFDFHSIPSTIAGVLISCYLVYSARISADQAVLAVRRRRPNAVQTREQLLCVQNFAEFLWPLRPVFPGVPGLTRDNEGKPRASNQPFNLPQFLKHQQHLLHGYVCAVHIVSWFLPGIIEGKRWQDDLEVGTHTRV